MACTGHSHDHEHAEEVTTHLRQFIDFAGVTCLNENIPGSVKSILKSYQDRLLLHPTLQSTLDGDPELLIHIPFTEAVSITSISIRGPPPSEEVSSIEFQTACPRSVRIFVDRDDLDFETAEELEAAMELELVHPDHENEVENGGTIDYVVRNRGRFQNIASVTIFVQENFGGDGFMTEVSPNLQQPILGLTLLQRVWVSKPICTPFPWNKLDCRLATLASRARV